MFLGGKKRDRLRHRVAIIGLDCAEPSLVFDRWADELPNLNALRKQGAFGELESVVPAITVPAWSCMTSGKDPGTLGVYGFRNRPDTSYEGFEIANSEAIRERRLWDFFSPDDDGEVIVLGVPGTYPPSRVHGSMVTSFLTPSIESEYTYPLELKQEIAEWVGEYMLDVDGFRTDDKDWLLERIYEMTEKRFEVARRLLDSRPWQFFMMVEMGVDRIHHGLWKDMDPHHSDHDPESPYRDAILEYYRNVDREIGTLLERFDDSTHVFVVSDHGARRMEGGIAINEWLIREGYLTLSGDAADGSAPVPFSETSVDWSRTRAWASGGYYGRVFLNLRGREPEGTVEPGDYDAVRDELAERIGAIPDHQGRPLETRCFRPEELYERVEGLPPDLLVYFDDLAWRSIGSVGWGDIYVFENDTGPDDANHAQNGILIYRDPKRDLGGRRLNGLHLLQVAPTVLELLGRPVPFDMQRQPIPQIIGTSVR